MKTYYATGRRKTSTARVYLAPGEGKITINNKSIEDYFGREYYRKMATSPFESVEGRDSYDIRVFTKGGGLTGQAGAIKLGVARALVELDMENRAELKRGGHLTRDSRKVERKKYGRKGARASFQFSKR